MLGPAAGKRPAAIVARRAEHISVFSIVGGELRYESRKGTPIPSNDISIAVHARETGADLVSFDGHFYEIDGLSFGHLEPFCFRAPVRAMLSGMDPSTERNADRARRERVDVSGHRAPGGSRVP